VEASTDHNFGDNCSWRVLKIVRQSSDQYTTKSWNHYSHAPIVKCPANNTSLEQPRWYKTQNWTDSSGGGLSANVPKRLVAMPARSMLSSSASLRLFLHRGSICQVISCVGILGAVSVMATMLRPSDHTAVFVDSRHKVEFLNTAAGCFSAQISNHTDSQSHRFMSDQFEEHIADSIHSLSWRSCIMYISSLFRSWNPNDRHVVTQKMIPFKSSDWLFQLECHMGRC